MQPRRIAVWLIEDSATDAFVIGEVLQNCRIPFDLTVLTDGDAALALLQRSEACGQPVSPELVLLDLNLPKIPGIQVLAALRQSQSCATVPVVVVTSSDSEADLKAIAELGVTSYFRKPHSLDAFMSLSDVIRGALSVG